jgi:hypothetical protein
MEQSQSQGATVGVSSSRSSLIGTTIRRRGSRGRGGGTAFLRRDEMGRDGKEIDTVSRLKGESSEWKTIKKN